MPQPINPTAAALRLIIERMHKHVGDRLYDLRLEAEVLLPLASLSALESKKPQLTIRYSITGETTLGALVSIMLQLDVDGQQLAMGASEVLFHQDGVQLYNSTAPEPEEILECLLQHVIDQDDIKRTRRIGKFLGQILPSNKFEPAKFAELVQQDEDDLANDLVRKLAETVTFNLENAP